MELFKKEGTWYVYDSNGDLFKLTLQPFIEETTIKELLPEVREYATLEEALKGEETEEDWVQGDD